MKGPNCRRGLLLTKEFVSRLDALALARCFELRLSDLGTTDASKEATLVAINLTGKEVHTLAKGEAKAVKLPGFVKSTAELDCLCGKGTGLGGSRGDNGPGSHCPGRFAVRTTYPIER